MFLASHCCADIFVPVLNHIFNPSLSQQYFSALWNQSVVVSVLLQNSTSVSNFRPISILNNFSNLFELVIYDHISHYPKFKISPYQHGFSKSTSAITNLISYADFISPLFSFQRQDDAIHFDLSNTFDLVPHSVLLHKLRVLGFLVAM
jgi:hypothetical protein